MNMQKGRTIFITTLTAASAFILGAWIIFGFSSARSVNGLLGENLSDLLFGVLSYGWFAIIIFAILVFAAMWGWKVLIDIKVVLVIFHVILAAIAAFFIWLFWFVDFMPGAA